jgi:hypothetical protein
MPNNPVKAGSKISLGQAKQYIEQLDLGYIIESMCASYYPLPRWEVDDATRCCALYKNFLFLQKKYLPEPLVPTKEIDEFWHNHILYTKKYFYDCLHIFGYYLHHEPTSPTDDLESLAANYFKTKERYTAEFNEPLVLFGLQK